MLNRSRRNFNLVRRYASMTRSSVVMINQVIPRSTFNVSVSVFTPSMIHCKSMSITQYLAICNYPVRISTLVGDSRLVMRRTQVVLSKIVRTLIAILMRGIVSLRIQDITIYLVYRTIIVRLLNVCDRINCINVKW